ncbi:MAG: NAD(P)-binding domain-containing protein [Anaerolineae bacterium]
MNHRVETVIVGGGQGGLSVSYYLSQQGHEHVVLDAAARPATAWRDARWDSFTLNTPNWTFRLPGAVYAGDDPDGFMAREDIVRYFEDYIERFKLPVRYGVRATSIQPRDSGYTVETDGGAFEVANVVVATGTFQRGKTSALGAKLPPEILQLDSGAYRNPDQLPPGAVLVVGSGQSGCQIAEELYESGRKVYLCVGTAGRAPRRYRGHDIFWWLNEVGFFDRTADQLPSPRARFAGAPQLSGNRGGHDINLHQFARDGVVLLGHLRGVEESKITLAPDLKDSLAKIDKAASDMVGLVNQYIERLGLDAPREELSQLRDGYDAEVITELDLDATDITSVIWAMGYAYDYSLVKLPIFDDVGYPVTQRGVTAYPGLYFAGLHWLHSYKSGLLLGVAADADYVATHLMGRT